MFFFFFFDDFKNRLRDLRLENNLTMEELANKVGCTRGAISNFENGNRKPSLDILISLADYFNVSIDYLVGRTDDPELHHL